VKTLHVDQSAATTAGAHLFSCFAFTPSGVNDARQYEKQETQDQENKGSKRPTKFGWFANMVAVETPHTTRRHAREQPARLKFNGRPAPRARRSLVADFGRAFATRNKSHSVNLPLSVSVAKVSARNHATKKT
jgi:hypothetical protein